jgi:formylmethanofuran dehydrogenase subunit E
MIAEEVACDRCGEQAIKSLKRNIFDPSVIDARKSGAKPIAHVFKIDCPKCGTYFDESECNYDQPHK